MQHFLHRTFAWQRLTVLSAETAVDHLLADSQEWGREPHSYVCRYSSAIGRRLASNSIELVAGALLREDTRLRPLALGQSFGARLRHAAVQTIVTSQEGRRRVAFSRLAAIAGAAWIASRWEPRPMSTARFFDRVGWSYIGQLENSLLAEFELDLKQWGRKVRNRLFGYTHSGGSIR